MADDPSPLVAAEVDLSRLDGFMLDTIRLLGSELVALSTGDEFKAAVLLWCRAWKQRPACSLPNDDKILASFAGGMSLAKWKKLRPMALRGFVMCSDGRLYHKVLATDAARAYKASKKRAAALEKWHSPPDDDGGPGDLSGDEAQHNPPLPSPRAHSEARSRRLAEARRKATHTTDEWAAMLDIFGHICLRCGTDKAIVKDHITPIYKGGSDGIENLQPLCASCNSSKGPDTTDWRWNACEDWRERLQKRLQDACEMPPNITRDGTGRDGTLSYANPESVSEAFPFAKSKVSQDFSGSEGSGSEGKAGGWGKWASQQARDEYAAAACVPFLAGGWETVMMAEDACHPDHVQACRAMAAAARQAKVGWVSPERRAPK